MRKEACFTLERFLEEVLYKEHVQDLLQEYGESTSGRKTDLIRRFLNSRSVREKNVDVLVREILEEVPATDLREFGRHLNLDMPLGKNDMVRHLMDVVDFEPYIRETIRHCPVCGRRTAHEIHFKPDWKASHTTCHTCNNEALVEQPDGEASGSGIDEPRSEPSAGVHAARLAVMTAEMPHNLNKPDDVKSSVAGMQDHRDNLTKLGASLPTHEQLVDNVRLAALTAGRDLLDAQAVKATLERESHAEIAKRIGEGTLWTIVGVLLAVGTFFTSILMLITDESPHTYAAWGIISILPASALALYILLIR